MQFTGTQELFYIIPLRIPQSEQEKEKKWRHSRGRKRGMAGILYSFRAKFSQDTKMEAKLLS